MMVGPISKPTGVSDSARLIWFLNTPVRVRVASSDGKDALSILEHRAPFADSPPLHVHNTEDEVFEILEGEFRIQLGGKIEVYHPGAIVLATKGIPHTYRVESSSGGHWLTVTARGDFERFVRAAGRAAEREALPSPAGPPTADVLRDLGALARTYGIDLIGPPLG